MRAAYSVIAIVCIVGVVCVSGGAPASYVVDLNDANFEELTQASTGSTTGPWFVEFFAPWCGHCKSLAPEWEKLAKEVKVEGIPVSIAKVDCTENSLVAHRFGIRGFPTLKMIANGKVYDYSGQRTATALKQFASGGYKGTTPSAVPAPQGTVAMIWDQITTTFQDALMMLARKPEVAFVLIGLGLVFGVIGSILVYALMSPAPQPWSPQPNANQQMRIPTGAIVSGVPMSTMPPATGAPAPAKTKKAE